jgi:hypothetical protein
MSIKEIIEAANVKHQMIVDGIVNDINERVKRWLSLNPRLEKVPCYYYEGEIKYLAVRNSVAEKLRQMGFSVEHKKGKWYNSYSGLIIVSGWNKADEVKHPYRNI